MEKGRIGHPCREPRCPAIAEDGKAYCEKHKEQEPKPFNSVRGRMKNPLYYTTTWQTVRQQKLMLTPVCEICRRAPGRIVHHVQPARENPELALELSNLQTVCFRCHQLETNREINKRRKET
jgi:5-methylcytosine-specific restriction enzyme A